MERERLAVVSLHLESWRMMDTQNVIPFNRSGNILCIHFNLEGHTLPILPTSPLNYHIVTVAENINSRCGETLSCSSPAARNLPWNLKCSPRLARKFPLSGNHSDTIHVWYIYHKNRPNVGKYAIHWFYGIVFWVNLQVPLVVVVQGIHVKNCYPPSAEDSMNGPPGSRGACCPTSPYPWFTSINH